MGSYANYLPAPTSYNLNGFLDDLESINQCKTAETIDNQHSSISEALWRDCTSCDAVGWTGTSGICSLSYGTFQGTSLNEAANSQVSDYDAAPAYTAGQAAAIMLSPPPPSSSETAPPTKPKFPCDAPLLWGAGEEWHVGDVPPLTAQGGNTASGGLFGHISAYHGGAHIHAHTRMQTPHE